MTLVGHQELEGVVCSPKIVQSPEYLHGILHSVEIFPEMVGLLVGSI
jgi:hypothetical protein